MRCDADLIHQARAVGVRHRRPLDGQTLGALAVQRGRARHGRAAKSSSDFGAVARLANFGRSGTAVVRGVDVNSQLREETTHGNVAIKHTAGKGHALAAAVGCGKVWLKMVSR